MFYNKRCIQKSSENKSKYNVLLESNKILLGESIVSINENNLNINLCDNHVLLSVIGKYKDIKTGEYIDYINRKNKISYEIDSYSIYQGERTSTKYIVGSSNYLLTHELYIAALSNYSDIELFILNLKEKGITEVLLNKSNVLSDVALITWNNYG